MTKKKDPADYKYGKPCTDHLGNKFKTAKDMCVFYGIPESTYMSRKRQGWDLERILTTPPRSYKWRTPGRNMGIHWPDEGQDEEYEEIPGSRICMEFEKKLRRTAGNARGDGTEQIL